MSSWCLLGSISFPYVLIRFCKVGKDFPSFSYTFIFIKTCLSSVKKKKKNKSKRKRKDECRIAQNAFRICFSNKIHLQWPFDFFKKIKIKMQHATKSIQIYYFPFLIVTCNFERCLKIATFPKVDFDSKSYIWFSFSFT